MVHANISAENYVPSIPGKLCYKHAAKLRCEIPETASKIMSNKDKSFFPDPKEVFEVLEAAMHTHDALPRKGFADTLPREGMGEVETLKHLSPYVLGEAAYLDDPMSFAHMNPPTPWVTWALAFWNARLNQNLLHPETGPFAREAERRVIQWLAPIFGLEGGHMCPGSTVANLTGLWAAREVAGIKCVVASEHAHLSIKKATHLLGLDFIPVMSDENHRIRSDALPDLSDAALVLTAGTTAMGAIDPLELAGKATWTHIDAAWGGPLAFSEKYRDRLKGIEEADSLSVSAHKLLFQPKESALIFFQDEDNAHDAVSFAGGYLVAPNIGLLGSHGATAIPLLGTFLSWGQQGMAERVERCMTASERLYAVLNNDPRVELLCKPETGVVVFRPKRCDRLENHKSIESASVSVCMIDDEAWLRCVAANPNADVDQVIEEIERLFRELTPGFSQIQTCTTKERLNEASSVLEFRTLT